MPRYALLLEYDGTGFVGWQKQENGLSLQAILEQAASRLAWGAPIESIVAGRTDAGVHATGQVAQIDLPVERPPHRVRDALNFHMLPHRVAVLRAAIVDDGWNARFSATRRAYVYRILNRPARAALEERRVWHVRAPLDAAAMQEAAQTLLGRHDFTSFRAAACQAKSPWRTLDRLDVERRGDLIEIAAEARSFLHHQVRNMAGTLRLVGEGRWSPESVALALAKRDRSAAGPTAPAHGLTLVRVCYATDPFTIGAG